MNCLKALEILCFRKYKFFLRNQQVDWKIMAGKFSSVHSIKHALQSDIIIHCFTFLIQSSKKYMCIADDNISFVNSHIQLHWLQWFEHFYVDEWTLNRFRGQENHFVGKRNEWDSNDKCQYQPENALKNSPEVCTNLNNKTCQCKTINSIILLL